MRQHPLPMRDLADGERAAIRRETPFSFGHGCVGVVAPAERNDHGGEDNGRL